MTTKNLFGDAESLYEEILREIELDIEKDHFFSEQASKEMIMSAIAKVLQNKFIIAMDWRAAKYDDLPVESEEEFVELLEKWNCDHNYTEQGELNIAIIGYLENALIHLREEKAEETVEIKVAVFCQSNPGESKAHVVNVKCSRAFYELDLAPVIAQNYILKNGVGQYPTFAITENEDKALVEALVSMGRILDA